MTNIQKMAYFGEKIVPIVDAHLSVASSAVLYGLSVYSVFPVLFVNTKPAIFRLMDHYDRLVNSAKIIGMDTFQKNLDFNKFKKAVKELVKANNLRQDSFIRATVHVSALVPGTRSRGLETKLSMFMYEASPIVPQNGARLKTSVWRRVPDTSIPARAKVNGAYVNSVLGKQDAIDSGYDDCLFLDTNGHVCELSASNVFMVRAGVLITPSTSNDILEGITRKTILELARKMKIPCVERNIDLTELYIADEVFACGTSTFIAPIIEIDRRKINGGTITLKLKKEFENIMNGKNPKYLDFI